MVLSAAAEVEIIKSKVDNWMATAVDSGHNSQILQAKNVI
jgi:hypothetical protein